MRSYGGSKIALNHPKYAYQKIYYFNVINNEFMLAIIIEIVRFKIS